MAALNIDEAIKTEQLHKDSIDTSSFFPDSETTNNATTNNATTTNASQPPSSNPIPTSTSTTTPKPTSPSQTYPQTLTNPTSTIQIHLTYHPLSLTTASAFTRSPTSGATLIFIGTTRNYFLDPTRPVSRLSYSTYPALALRTLMRIATSVQEAHGIERIYIAHRLGEVAVAEESIIVAVSSAHRGPGWKGGEELLERVKREAEIWKREWFVDGAVVVGRDGDVGEEVGVWRDNRESDSMGVRTEVVGMGGEVERT